MLTGISVLIGYFDESGHSSATEFVSLAAFVAEESDWVTFDARWRETLNRLGAPYLHMREFAHRISAFKDWAEDRRKALLGECVSSINAIRAVAVGAAISVADFRNLDELGRSRLQDPFFCCFQEVVRGVAINAHFEEEGYKVDMIFSRQDDFGRMARKLWNAMAQTIDVKERMGSLTFADMRDTPALQAADLLAYEFRHYYQLRKTRPGSPPRWPFQELVRYQREVHEAHMLKYLPGWYLEAQAAGTFNQLMHQMWSDPGRFWPALSEMFPQV